MSRLDKLHKLREADPTDADVPYMIAQEVAKEGDHETAIEWYDRCIELDPNYLYAYFQGVGLIRVAPRRQPVRSAGLRQHGREEPSAS